MFPVFYLLLGFHSSPNLQGPWTKYVNMQPLAGRANSSQTRGLLLKRCFVGRIGFPGCPRWAWPLWLLKLSLVGELSNAGMQLLRWINCEPNKGNSSERVKFYIAQLRMKPNFWSHRTKVPKLRMSLFDRVTVLLSVQSNVCSFLLGQNSSFPGARRAVERQGCGQWTETALSCCE